MRPILFLLISFVLIACNVTPVAETPTPELANVAYIVETPDLSAVTTDTGACAKTPTPYNESDKSLLGVWRVRHDVERTDWDCKARLWEKGWRKLRGLPETVRINGGRGTVELSPAWIKFLDAINSPDAQRYLRKLQSGWLNYGPFPKMEQLTFGGNYVEVTRIEGNKAFIKTFSNGDIPPHVAPNTLVQVFSVVYTDGTWEMATPVGLVFTFIIANPDEEGKLWIDINNLIR